MVNSKPFPTDVIVSGWGYGNDGIVVHLQHRNVTLTIELDAENVHRSPTALARLRTLETKFASNDRDDENDCFDHCEEIAAYFLAELQKLAPPLELSGIVTLADIAVKNTYRAQLKFYDEQPSPGALILWDSPPADEEGIGEGWNSVLASSPFPRFKQAQVEVIAEDGLDIFCTPPNDVRVDGQKLYYKPAWIPRDAVTAIDKYRKIHEFEPALRTSRLYGIVLDHEFALAGMLYHWIDIKRHITWDVLDEVSPNTRTQWASQIEDTVKSLHSIGVVWGDAKVDNVVIDINGDAVVIDFEGGATKGWVDRELMETKDGDLQGLERLVDFILNENSSLRLRYKSIDLHGFPDHEESDDGFPT